MSEIVGQKIKIKGLVQGVGYRFHCRNVATKLGLKGYVVNLPDKDVEIEVFGERKNINEFISEITRSDKAFSIFDILVDDIPEKTEYNNFIIKLY